MESAAYLNRKHDGGVSHNRGGRPRTKSGSLGNRQLLCSVGLIRLLAKREMKTLLLMLFAAWTLAGCVSQPTSMRHSAGRVLLPKDMLYVQGDGEWKPTAEQIAACENALARALQRKGLKLEDYYIRYAATTRGGLHSIEGYGAHRDHTNREDYLKEADGSNRIILVPFGGGRLYFRFSYDADRDRITKCELNAPL